MKNKNNDAYLIASVLKKNGFEALYAGGCVRDFLLKKQPKLPIFVPLPPPQMTLLMDEPHEMRGCP